MFALITTTIMLPEFILTSGIQIATNLINSVNFLIKLSHSDSDLKNLLTTSDVLDDLGIIKQFILEQKSREHTQQSVSVCIDSLNQTLIQLENNINSITQKIQNHRNLWFNFIRSYGIDEEKKQIPILINKMRHRFELTIKMITAQNHDNFICSK